MKHFKKHIGLFLTVGFLFVGISCYSVYTTDEHHGDQKDPFHLSYSQSEDSEDSSPGMNKLVFVKQVLSYSFLPAEVFSGNLNVLLRHQKFLLEEYSGLFERLAIFFHDVTLSPHKSGIAIHAP